MDEKTAVKLLGETFNSSFDSDRFSKFTKELLNEFAIAPKEIGIWTEYRDYISSAHSLGIYEDQKKELLEVFVVKLQRTGSIQRARTMQRNFIAKYLGKFNKNAALVAFYGEDPEDWRFSFIKLEYNLKKDDKGDVKPVEELSPAKRYSYLVGINEPNHTCKKQFLELLKNEEVNPSIEEIENAFSVDNVTKEFFNEYKELYLNLKESLERIIEKNSQMRKEFEDKGISSIDFSKKLLGQIVFIYFLQKKGWLGVGKDSKTGEFKPWGQGPKNFLRKLYNKEIVSYNNFFNDILEPLFYDALSTERDKDYYTPFKCRVPFLNGGLFEAINQYDWTSIEIPLENPIFGNILETFDRYNFTVKEDEPLEKEVAIDPEMLGKVFENLLEIKDRKSKGSYYTPREIVHYMCQQSLINYLQTRTGIPREDIERYIQLRDTNVGEDIRHVLELRKLEKDMISGRDIGIIDKQMQKELNQLKTPLPIIKEKEKIDLLLADIKIVDPAVGSGAFPVGMMNEIVKARSVLTNFYSDEEQKKRTEYNLKRQTIENSLYGVDIDSSAVDIAKLRFWLSLIVDEQDMEKIQPLPNLDYKIMCGNSLLEEFEGIKLFDEKLLQIAKDVTPELTQIGAEKEKLGQELNQIYTGKKKDDGRIKEINRRLDALKRKKQELLSGPKEGMIQASLNSEEQRKIKESQKKLKELIILQRQFFNEQNKKQKTRLREEVDRLEWQLIEETLKEQGNKEAIEKLDQYKKNKSKPFFLWKLYFSEVFQEKGGFDVVIANPPYVFGGNAGISSVEKGLFKKKYFSGSKKINLFSIFIEQGVNLLRTNGFLVYITPNTLLRVTSYSNIREFLVKNTKLEEIMDLDTGVFENVTASTIVTSLTKKKTDLSNLISIRKNLSTSKFNEIPQSDFNNKGYVFAIFSSSKDRAVIKKIKNKAVTLGTLTKNIRFGVVITLNINEVVCNTKINSEWKPFLEGNEIGKYRIKYTGRYLHYKKDLLHRSRTPEIFESPKIMVQRITGGDEPIKATYDLEGYYNKESIINVLLLRDKDSDYKFLLALLNSRLINWFYTKEYSNESKLTVNLSKEYLSEIPIKSVSNEQQIAINKIVDQILPLTKDSDYSDNPDKQAKVRKLEKEIDQLVYKLYELTPEEIGVVASFGREN